MHTRGKREVQQTRLAALLGKSLTKITGSQASLCAVRIKIKKINKKIKKNVFSFLERTKKSVVKCNKWGISLLM